jgi:hypothetical protein
MVALSRPHSVPSGHLSPQSGERKPSWISVGIAEAFPLPRMGGEVARRAGVGALTVGKAND